MIPLAALQALVGLLCIAVGTSWYSGPAGLLVFGAGLVFLAWPRMSS